MADHTNIRAIQLTLMCFFLLAVTRPAKGGKAIMHSQRCFYLLSSAVFPCQQGEKIKFILSELKCLLFKFKLTNSSSNQRSSIPPA